MSFSKFASFVSKVTIEVMRNFFECLPRIVTLQNYVMNASLYSCCLRFTKQEQTLYPGEPNNGNFRYVNCDFWDRSGKFGKWHCLRKNGHRIQTPSSKLMILVSSCWKKNFIRNNGHSLFILSLVFLKSLIVSVAFFLGHPVYGKRLYYECQFANVTLYSQFWYI